MLFVVCLRKKLMWGKNLFILRLWWHQGSRGGKTISQTKKNIAKNSAFHGFTRKRKDFSPLSRYTLRITTTTISLRVISNQVWVFTAFPPPQSLQTKRRRNILESERLPLWQKKKKRKAFGEQKLIPTRLSCAIPSHSSGGTLKKPYAASFSKDLKKYYLLTCFISANPLCVRCRRLLVKQQREALVTWKNEYVAKVVFLRESEVCADLKGNKPYYYAAIIKHILSSSSLM